MQSEDNRYDILQIEYTTLKKSLDELKLKHDKLSNEHDALKNDYRENTIVQSMNEMKERYDRLLQTTVSNHKYNILYEKYTKMIRYFTTCSVLIDHIYKLVKQTERITYNSDIKQLLYKIVSGVNITKDIMEDSLE